MKYVKKILYWVGFIGYFGAATLIEISMMAFGLVAAILVLPRCLLRKDWTYLQFVLCLVAIMKAKLYKVTMKIINAEDFELNDERFGFKNMEDLSEIEQWGINFMKSVLNGNGGD